MSATLDLALDLLTRPSLTPVDAGCQDVMIDRLASGGFAVERMRYGEVENFWARRGRGSPVLCFLGHTDVVPTGPREEWQSDPFKPEVRDGLLYARGAADMKTGLAAIVTAIEAFVAAHPQHRGSIAVLITSDEEGRSIDGTKRVMEELTARGERIDWCLVGEPSSVSVLGDTIKVGRRGSLSGRLKVLGTQGHVAYPQLADNPVHRFAPALTELSTRIWDAGTEHFPPTTFQVSNIAAGTGAPNVIPGELNARFNIRYSPVQTLEGLKATVLEILARHGVRHTLEWFVSGEPFFTPPGELSNAVCAAVAEIAGRMPQLSTTGGTSDGRFVAPTGAQVVELGVVNASIHKVNECVRVADLDDLHRMYVALMRRLLA